MPGIQNPADLATRCQSAIELAESMFWLEGPSFLKDDENSCPAAPSGREVAKFEDSERRVPQTYVFQAHVDSVNPNHFSTFACMGSTIRYKLQTSKKITKTG